MPLSANLFPNPSAEINTFGVNATLGTVERDTIGVTTGTSHDGGRNGLPRG